MTALTWPTTILGGYTEDLQVWSLGDSFGICCLSALVEAPYHFGGAGGEGGAGGVGGARGASEEGGADLWWGLSPTSEGSLPNYQ